MYCIAQVHTPMECFRTSECTLRHVVSESDKIGKTMSRKGLEIQRAETHWGDIQEKNNMTQQKTKAKS